MRVRGTKNVDLLTHLINTGLQPGVDQTLGISTASAVSRVPNRWSVRPFRGLQLPNLMRFIDCSLVAKVEI